MRRPATGQAARTRPRREVVLRRCDTYPMKRIGAVALVVVIVAVACIVAAPSLIGGGTVRSPRGTAGEPVADLTRELAEDVSARRGPGNGDGDGPGANGGTAAAAPGISFAAVGDTMLGNTPELPSDPGSYLDRVRGQLTGDVVFGNLEGTLTDVSESPKCGDDAPAGSCYAFRTPPSYAGDLAAAGFTVMNNANNHSYDFGPAGLEETVAALHRAGIAQDGLPGEVTVVKAGGEKVAFVGFAPYAQTASLLDLGTARALIRRASRHAPIVVVAIHAGAEGADAQHVTGGEETYLGEDRGNPEAFAKMAVRAGADLVFGSGPHVLRGMEIYRGRLIAYSLGNFTGFHNFETTGVSGASAVLHVTVAKDGAFRSGRIASVRLVEAGQPVPDPSDEGAHLIAALSREDLGKAAVRIDADGRILGTVAGG
jgi:poly-gamma-glutamate capsule biosynthesis protein CapA/YwtB (metallophosphatase superfamily)